ncbi:hypothetical protein GGQ61_003718 [Phenylobacterium haematophilum]|jgi:hypothetical protein|uniref:PH domain-containing protein n=1 Tax=Phenylobacterium haematophilum TaxID=98513 RepID=A0A840A5Z4_9CAUL|nr:hypothetical protein [Phenylobacterium haematophilum]MBB3892980.1 hypothetical protein [Phenylobacterium haematophilum]
MTAYIVYLKSDAAAAYEVAFCETDAEAREWADAIVTLTPGFELAAIQRTRAGRPETLASH